MAGMNTLIVDIPTTPISPQESANDVIILDTYGPQHQNRPVPFLNLAAVEDDRPDWIARQLLDGETGMSLGYASQRINPTSLTRFVAHRTGICGLVQRDDLVYFVFPGAELVLDDTSIQLTPGESIKHLSLIHI